jgi:hypothetical protein
MASVKHDYFIEDLGQPRGWFKAHRYRYHPMASPKSSRQNRTGTPPQWLRSSPE